MTSISYIELFTFLTVLVSLGLLLRGWKLAISKQGKIILFCLLFLLLAHSALSILEWSSFAFNFDRLEDYLQILHPVFWGFIFYIFLMDDQISRRIEVENSLRESEVRFRTIYENISVGLASVSLDFRIISANRAYCNMLGYRTEELPGLHLRDITYPDDVQENMNLQKKLAAGEIDHFRMEKRFIHKSGKTVFGILDANLIKDASGKPVYFLGSVIDITAREKSERKFKEIFNSTSEAIFIDSLEGGKLVDCNDRAVEIYGFENKEDILKCGILDLSANLPPYDEQQAKKHIEDAVKTSSKTFEWLAKKKNGEHFWVEVSLRKTEIEGENRVLTVVRDIADRKRAEQAFGEMNTRLYAVFDAAEGVPIQGYDQNRKVIFWNRSSEKVYGYSREEAMGKKLEDLIIPDQMQDGVIKDINTWLEDDIPIPASYLILKGKNNNQVPVYSSHVMIENHRGDKEMFCIDVDISELKRAEQIQKILYQISNAASETDSIEELIDIIRHELSEVIDTTNYYIALYEESTDTITLPFIRDERDDFKSFPAGKTLTGYVIQSGKPLLVRKQQMEAMEAAGEIEPVGSPSEVWLGVPLKMNEKVTGVLAVQSYNNPGAYDEADLQLLAFVSEQISRSIEQKKSKEELVQALQKAREADRLKSAFLANMSHEIRTPMNGILGFTDLLAEADLDQEEKLRYIDVIRKNGDRLMNTINDLIDISKIEAGQMPVTTEPTCINEQLDELETFFRLEAQKKNLLLECIRNQNDHNTTVLTDREKLYAILSNLIKNAIKYTQKGSITCGYRKKENEYEFYVRDTGTGIPADRQEAIFERFVQADLKLSRPYEGSGLGLAITKAYVEMLGGRIWLKSTEGKGSTFYFTLPLNDLSIQVNEKKQTIETPTFENRPVGEAVLITEDEESAALHLTKVLENQFRKIYHAKTGTEAVDAFRNHPDIQLVLMDIKMPEMDGYEATQRIREFDKEVIIIAQTAYALTGDREKALAAGCNDYITKPIKRNVLKAILNQYLTG